MGSGVDGLNGGHFGGWRGGVEEEIRGRDLRDDGREVRPHSSFIDELTNVSKPL